MANTFTPDDSRYDAQWHLQLLGDLEHVWADYTGKGVTVGVYDDGVDYEHVDLDDNVDQTLVPTFKGELLPFLATRNFDTHGTSVAGLIAAEQNGEGVVGVAFEAKLGGVNVIGAGARNGDAAYKAAFDQMDLFDITNHSWGNDAQFSDIEGGSAVVLAAFETTAEEGRDGLGTIHVKATANLQIHAQAEDIQTTRHMIQVSAADSLGDESNFAARGSSLFVVAPTADDFEGITTTDRVGRPGDTNGDYTNFFGGTSSSTPMVSGVIALMLEANPNLGWRDVQEILALSSTHIGADPGEDATGNAMFVAQFNGSMHWNGGGYHVSEDYGFGAIHAYNAVRLAEVWSLFDAPATSANERTEDGGMLEDLGLRISHTDPVEVDLEVSGLDDLALEHVTVHLDLTHQRLRDVTIELVSPSGTVINLLDPRLAGSFREYNASGRDGIEWSFPVTLLRGEDANGTWTIRVTDDRSGKNGVLEDFGLTFHGGTRDEMTSTPTPMRSFGRSTLIPTALFWRMRAEKIG